MKKFLSVLLSLILLLTGVCAFAEESLPLQGKLVILHTNDVHGRAVGTDSVFGYAKIAQAKKNLEAQGAEVLLIDAGDFSQGMPIVNMDYGKEAVAFMNEAGYDFATLGNHEFDWGTDNLLQNLSEAHFTTLCANIIRTSDKELLFPANAVVEKGGVKIGLFGLITPETMTKAHPDKVKSITMAQGEELYAIAQAQVDALHAEGCELVICIGHLGIDKESEPNRSVDVMQNVTGIDLFIDGHSHSVLNGGYVVDGEVLDIVSTGTAFANIGYVFVDKTVKDEQVTIKTVAGLYSVDEDKIAAEMTATAGLTADEMVEAIVNAVDKQVTEELGKTFAKTEVLLDGNKAPGVRTQETNLGDFAADAILWQAQQSVGDKVVAALTNGGGIRATIQIGDVTMLDMKTVFPFGNTVATLEVSGATLLEALEAATYTTPDAIGAFPQVAGIEYTIDTTVPFEKGEAYPGTTYFAPAKPGSRVTIQTVGGEPWEADKMYTIATNDFVAAGGDTYYRFAYDYKQTGINTGVAMEDALVNYTRDVLNGVIGEQYAQPAGRITIK